MRFTKHSRAQQFAAVYNKDGGRWCGMVQYAPRRRHDPKPWLVLMVLT